MDTTSSQPRLPRRVVFKWFAAAAAAMQVGGLGGMAAFAADPTTPPPAGPPPPMPQTRPGAGKGYGTDPKLNVIYEPGDVWPLLLTAAHRATATVLADLILPADDLGPAASELRVVDFIDEWVSAPYPEQVHDYTTIVGGLEWLETEANTRFQIGFAKLSAEQQRAICDDICFAKQAAPQFEKPAAFFSRFRSVASGAYYATPAGWKAIGYTGNVPLPSFDGPPPEVLAKLGVEQTVK